MMNDTDIDNKNINCLSLEKVDNDHGRGARKRCPSKADGESSSYHTGIYIKYQNTDDEPLALSDARI